VAIQFTTGTINQPDAGSVGLAMVEKIRDDVVAHAAWDLVEEFTPASGLVRWYVLKCLAAQSGLSADFFVVIGRTLGSGELRMFICEQYNPTTHVASKYCIASPSSNTVLYDSLGRIPDATTYTLSTAVLTGSGLTPFYNSWIPSGTSVKFWVIVDNDGFSVAFNGASNGFFHCGAYIPLSIVSSLLPVHTWGSSSSGSANAGAITRNPASAVPGNTLHGAALMVSSTSANVLGFQGELRYNDALQGGQRVVAEQGIVMAPVFSADVFYPQWGYALGKVKRMRANYTSAPVGAAFGDAYVLQGRLWVPYLQTDGRMWDTGVAS
jgi:hypothetical protein